MNTRSKLPDAPLFGGKRCVYCSKAATTSDHTPPKCLLQRPLPSNLITLPACQECNTGFSFDEEVVRAILTLVSSHPDLVAERESGGRLDRSLERNGKLRAVLEQSRQSDGGCAWTDEVLLSFQRVFRKTVQGLFYGLYERLVPAEEVRLLRVEDHRHITPEDLVAQLRPSPLRDITDEPLSEVTPSSWHSREPVLMFKLQPVSGGAPIERVFRLVRETQTKWETIQPRVFRYAFVEQEGEATVCVIDLWDTLLIALAAPWPSARGPLRGTKRNSASRDASKHSP